MTDNNHLPQEYMSLADCAKKWEMSAGKVRKFCEEEKIAGAAKLGKSWIIPSDAERPVIESRLSRPVTPKNRLQELALEHIEDGVPFAVTEYEVGKTTYTVSSIFKRQGPTLEESMISLIMCDIEQETGVCFPIKKLAQLKAEVRKNSNAAKATFEDYIHTYRERLKSYGFSEEDIEVLLEKIAADYEPFVL